MFRKAVWIGLALSVLGFAAVSSAQGNFSKTSVLTFSQPVEVGGRVLPAGTYMFMLATPLGDRHVVEIRSADGSQLITTVAAIPNYRLRPTGKTVITFREVTRGAPEAIRAWFYPGDNYGQEFVYPKRRALALAKVSESPVPSMAAETPTPEETKTAPITAVTSEEKEVPVTQAIQTTPPAAAAPMEAPAQKELPKTASNLPLITLLGLGSLGLALGLIVVARRAKGSAV